MPIQIGSKGATIGGINYPPYAYIDWLSPDQEAAVVQGGNATSVPVRGLTPAQIAQLQAMIAGSGVDVAFLRDFDGTNQGYTLDAGSGNVLPVMRVTVEAPTYVMAGARVGAGGINAFATTITGASLTGEIIPISVGTSKITRVHVGLSGGTNQLIDGNGTVTLNELGAWSCLDADDCNLVYVQFSPPRSAGRYCDVSIVGKKRA